MYADNGADAVDWLLIWTTLSLEFLSISMQLPVRCTGSALMTSTPITFKFPFFSKNQTLTINQNLLILQDSTDLLLFSQMLEIVHMLRQTQAAQLSERQTLFTYLTVKRKKNDDVLVTHVVVSQS